MKKAKRIEAACIQLPEAIIQHIQSFMNGKEAVQTTLFSKSWYDAWLTRPNLDFDEKDFVKKKSVQFWEFVNKTMERYEKLKLTIDSLRLWIHGSLDLESIHLESILFSEVIMKALRMGATDLDVAVHNLDTEIVLSPDVFRSENLIRLSVTGCRVGLGTYGKVTYGKVSCSRLKSLVFKRVYVEGNAIWDIISSCPLIENFELSTAYWRPITEFGNGPNEFRKLKSLGLYRVNVHPYFDDNFSSKFPCIKDLTLHSCPGCKVMQISSPSLEYINFFAFSYKLVLKLDVPRIRKFTFSGSCVPSLLLKTTTTSDWESDISIGRRRRPPNATWFLQLSRLLKKLSQSKVSLSLSILSDKSLKYAGKIRGLRNKPKVENLTIHGPVSPDIVYSLLRCCRPTYVTQYRFSRSYMPSEKPYNDFMKFANERISQQVSLNSCIAYQKTSVGECDLEEVSEEVYDVAASAWRPRLLDTSTSLGAADEHKSRLHLRWVH